MEIELSLSDFGKLMKGLPGEQQEIIYAEINKYIAENVRLKAKLTAIDLAYRIGEE